MSDDSAKIEMMTALLLQGRYLLQLSIVSMAITLLEPLLISVSAAALLLLCASGIIGLVSLWYGLRASFDAALFARVSTGKLDLAGLDRALHEMGLVSRETGPRNLVSRLRGAMRLLLLQVIATLVQLALLSASISLHIAG